MRVKRLAAGLLGALLVVGMSPGVATARVKDGQPAGLVSGLREPSLAGVTPGEGTGPGWCTKYGTDGAKGLFSYDDVWACGPDHTVGPTPFDSNGKLSFQCVELSERFLWAIDALAPIFGKNVNGATLVSVYHSAHQSIGVGSPGPAGLPQPGDVMSFNEGGVIHTSDGHTAVVVSGPNSSGNFTIMSQNWSNTAGEETVHIDMTGAHDGHVQLPGSSFWNTAQFLELTTTGPSPQMLLDSAGQVWAKSSIGNGGWTQETPAGETKIAAGGDGLQMLLDSAGQVWAKNSIGNGGWTQETPAGETAIAAGGNGLQMLLDSAGQVWAKSSIGNGGWTQETPAGETKIAAGGNGLQMLLDSAGQVWAKSSIGNGGWTQETSAAETKIAAGGGGLQMLLDSAGQVWAKNSIGNGGWTQESPSGEVAIAAGGNGLQMLLDSAGQVWAKNSIGNGGWTQETPTGETKISAGA